MRRIRKLDLRAPAVIEAERAACQAWTIYVVSRRVALDRVEVILTADTAKLDAAFRRASNAIKEVDYQSYARLSLTNDTRVASLTKGDIEYLGILHIVHPHWWHRFLQWVCGCR